MLTLWHRTSKNSCQIEPIFNYTFYCYKSSISNVNVLLPLTNRSQKNIIVSSLLQSVKVWCTLGAIVYFHPSVIFMTQKDTYINKKVRQNRCILRQVLRHDCVESERGTRRYLRRREARIFLCGIDKILLDQNYFKSHVISQQLNSTMRLNQQEAFRLWMVGKIMAEDLSFSALIECLLL